MEHDKNVCQRRTYVYRTQLEIETKAEVESREYCSVREAATLGYIDLPTSKPGGGDCPVEETRRVRCAERMDSDNLTCYPLAMVNRVAWNNNLGSHLLLASGGQAGIVRIHRLGALDTDQLQQAVKSVERKFMS